MYTSINHNLMAANTARNLNSHYSNLATSTQRLSSGLRINSAADDAAGLAIRELQRADIASLHQGARNANDAISMIQVADGALGIIDEKLIRMKELAEQAATGTYSSTQRLMIESEYQAMASEITRIANATDFNGIHLLDGSLKGKHDGSGLNSTGAMKIHFGSGNDSAEDYYYIEIGNCTAAALGVGMVNPTVKTYTVGEWVEHTTERNWSLKNDQSYETYKDPDTGKIYYKDGDIYFSNLIDPASSYLDTVADIEIINRLIPNTTPVTDSLTDTVLKFYDYIDLDTGNIYYRYYDPQDKKYLFVDKINDVHKTIFDPDNLNDKNIIDKLIPILNNYMVDSTWKCYVDASEENIYYSIDDGVTFVSDPYTQKIILDSRNQNDLSKIAELKPVTKGGNKIMGNFHIAPGTPVVTDTIEYVRYKDPISGKKYFSSDGGTTFYDDYDAANQVQLDPATDAEIIARLKIDPTQSTLKGRYFDIYRDSSGKMYVTRDNGNTFYEYYFDTSVSLRKGVDDAKIADLTIDKSQVVFGSHELYKVYIDKNEPTIKYYSIESWNGPIYFTDLSDREGSTLNSNSPIINRLEQIQQTVRYDSTFYEYFDPVTNIHYGTSNHGQIFVKKGDSEHTVALNSNNSSDKDIINRLEPYLVPDNNTIVRSTFENFIDPVTNIEYYKAVGSDSSGYFKILQDDILDLDNPASQTIIDRLQPVPTTITVHQYTPAPPVPDEFYVYIDHQTGRTYYSGDGGQTFTTNPTNPSDQGSYLDASNASDKEIMDRLEMATIKTTTREYVEREVVEVEEIDMAGKTISTQEAAQKALAAIDNAILSKDKIRAHLGALQNRLENTVSNLNIQAENLQAAESRISDVDVATEMTEFVRNQILTQSATAMLGQANSAPQMLMQLIGN